MYRPRPPPHFPLSPHMLWWDIQVICLEEEVKLICISLGFPGNSQEFLPFLRWGFLMFGVTLNYNLTGCLQVLNFRLPLELELGFPGGTSGKEPACQCGRHSKLGFHPCVGKIPWRRKWQPTPVFLSENPMNRGSQWTTVHGVAKSQIWLKWLRMHAELEHC